MSKKIQKACFRELKLNSRVDVFVFFPCALSLSLSPQVCALSILFLLGHVAPTNANSGGLEDDVGDPKHNGISGSRRHQREDGSGDRLVFLHCWRMVARFCTVGDMMCYGSSTCDQPVP